MSIERKKVALNQETYEKLKNFSRYKAVRLRVVVDAMIDLVLEDEALCQRVLELTLEKEAKEAREGD